MKKYLFIILSVFCLQTLAQKKTIKPLKPVEKSTIDGIKFKHKITSWNDVIKQATKESKYIFVDCYTTWCGPCKYVSSKIFPQKSVGDFYNKNFVNIGLQIDETDKDNADVIATRKVAKMIEEKYEIKAYPTFLIFDKKGNLVHKLVGAGNEEHFINKGKEALDPNKQFYTLKNQFYSGTRDKIFLKNLIVASSDAGENANDFLAEYIKTADTLYSFNNAKLLLNNVEKTSDVAFNHLYANKEKWYPFVRKNSFIKTLSNPIEEDILESIEKNEDPNWKEIAETYKIKFAEVGDFAVNKVKANYYFNKENWKALSELMVETKKTSLELFESEEEKNQIAWAIFENSNDGDALNIALSLSEETISSNTPAQYLDTYANILYKLGRVDEAILYQTKAVKKAGADDKKNMEETLAKMKKGEKTWKL